MFSDQKMDPSGPDSSTPKKSCSIAIPPCNQPGGKTGSQHVVFSQASAESGRAATSVDERRREDVGREAREIPDALALTQEFDGDTRALLDSEHEAATS